MQKIRILFLIALGSSLLLSAFTRGTSASAMYTTAITVNSTSSISQQTPELAYAACARCHPNMSTAVNSHQLAYISYQARLFDRSSLSRWTQDEVIDEHDLYFILVDQHHAQSAHLTDFSGPIVQCSFCHPGAVEKVLSTALNSD